MRYIASLVAVAAGAFASATPVFIENPSFEAQTLGSGDFFYSPTQITGWSSTATGGADRGVWHTTATGKDAINIAFAYANNAIAQQLSATLVADRTYTLDYLLGRTGSTTDGSVELWAGGTVSNGVVTGGTLLASKTVNLNSGVMTEYSMDYTSPSAGSIIGQALTVRLLGTTRGGSYVSFDNIRLSANPVPEPASMLALGAGAVALLRRRKRS